MSSCATVYHAVVYYSTNSTENDLTPNSHCRTYHQLNANHKVSNANHLLYWILQYFTSICLLYADSWYRYTLARFPNSTVLSAPHIRRYLFPPSLGRLLCALRSCRFSRYIITLFFGEVLVAQAVLVECFGWEDKRISRLLLKWSVIHVFEAGLILHWWLVKRPRFSALVPSIAFLIATFIWL